ncbi:MAG: SusC/RagA family TonB-linked outer membrane protein [Candidatus Pedobacter colombiensis]|uniref:SusC/RagA family TonB-linked outer membrane protein n=1 Tax=Candidatus Pedobacter colombiensis TaxID=3121371 RepID=A0AAJ5W664_9SPHI|nr:SusC/RagA family TonB-linked outer membrane protein [Pedobacter sp.]WEK17848.1 MAG: SusC/RagA family TonB-linked outer membrane protein [Pedobacter sp.]
MKLYTFKLGNCQYWHPPKILTIVSSALSRVAKIDKRKLLMRVNLVIFLLISSLLQVSASSFGQKISYTKNGVTLREFFKEITIQTGYNVLYAPEKVKATQRINVDFKEKDLIEVLQKICADEQFVYTIDEKNVFIKPAEQSLIGRIIAAFKTIDVKGRIVDENGSGLAGANIKVKNNTRWMVTDEEGFFTFKNIQEKSILVISYLGRETLEIPAKEDVGTIKLVLRNDKLNEVQIVSTGYQELPKERATGSFTTIDNKTINRSVSTNILDRLDGVTSGVLFTRGYSGIGSNNPKISIHGRSTLFAGAEPLIVVNGFPYDGTIDQINPADVENINILKDAAASSIWGSRSGNGVIVITTKSGHNNQKLQIEASSTLTVTDKPDLYYPGQLSAAEFIDLEQYLFSKGLFTSNFSNPYNVVSAGVEIFNQRKNNKITSADSAAKIDALKSYDIRADLNRYMYRPRVQQQYQLNLRGGTENYRYYMSGGYNKNLESSVPNHNERLTLNLNNTYGLFNNRLELSGDVNIASIKTHTKTVPYTPYTPYDRLVDENGNSLAVVKDYRMSYVDTAGKGKLLDWHFRPIDELFPNQEATVDQYRLKVGANFKIIEGLGISANYMSLNQYTNTETLSGADSYAARNLINRYTSISGNTVNRVIPVGGIFSKNNNVLQSQSFRSQLNYHKIIANDHEITAILGYEGSDSRSNIAGLTYYGYDAETLTNANGTIDPLKLYKLYYGQGSGSINTAPGLTRGIDINQSYYINASYGYKGRYMLSGSARRDESNIFGVKTNQKGVPLWSTGIAWILDREKFYQVEWLPALKLRLTYGYNGNVDKTVSAYSTAAVSSQNINGDTFARLVNPPNPSLRWERVKTWNLGFDFGFKRSMLTGSIDFYQKNAFDLIGNNPIAMQSGILQFKGNGANLQTKGIDIQLNSRNLTGALLWTSTFLFNFNTDKVTKYDVKQKSNATILISNSQNPLVGYPYNAIFSFPSAGLDAAGAPQGYLNGVVSKDYGKINSLLDPSQLIFHGSATPKYFGSLINTFNYQNFELTFNIIYKFDYYFRRVGVFSGSNYGSAAGLNYNLTAYNQRWQKPGDELLTHIPALNYPGVTGLDQFFTYSEDLVEKGDHIRLQDIRLSYNLAKHNFNKLPFKSASVFFYGRNLGVLWRQNRLHIDPDFGSNGIPQPFSGSLGINLTL